MMKRTGEKLATITEPLSADKCVVVPKWRYDELIALECRAQAKLDQLRDTPTIQQDGRPETESYIRCLAWLLGEID